MPKKRTGKVQATATLQNRSRKEKWIARAGLDRRDNVLRVSRFIANFDDNYLKERGFNDEKHRRRTWAMGRQLIGPKAPYANQKYWTKSRIEPIIKFMEQIAEKPLFGSRYTKYKYAMLGFSGVLPRHTFSKAGNAKYVGVKSVKNALKGTQVHKKIVYTQEDVENGQPFLQDINNANDITPAQRDELFQFWNRNAFSYFERTETSKRYPKARRIIIMKNGTIINNPQRWMADVFLKLDEDMNITSPVRYLKSSMQEYFKAFVRESGHSSAFVIRPVEFSDTWKAQEWGDIAFTSACDSAFLSGLTTTIRDGNLRSINTREEIIDDKQCYIRAILDKFRDNNKVNERFKNAYGENLTREALQNVFSGYPTGITFNILRELFLKPCDISCNLYNYLGNKVCSYEGSQDRHSEMNLILFDNHIYLTRKGSIPKTEIYDQRNRVMPMYVRKSEENSFAVADTAEQVFKLITETECKHLTIHYNDCINSLLLLSIRNWKYRPRATFDSSLQNIKSLQFKYTKSDREVFISVQNSHLTDYTERMIFKSKKQYFKHTNEARKFQNVLLNSKTESFWSDCMKILLEKYGRGGAIGTFRETGSEEQFDVIDFRRQFTSILKDITKVPQFGTNDVLKKYKKQPIKDHIFYYIKNYTDEKCKEKYPKRFRRGKCAKWRIFSNTQYDFVYGANLREAKELGFRCKILGYVEPYKVNNVDFKTPVEKLYNSKLKDRFFKTIPNITVGLAGRRKVIDSNVEYFENDIEARLICEKNNAYRLEHTEICGIRYALVVRDIETLYENGSALGILVRDTARLQMFRESFKYKKIVGVNHDSFYVEKGSVKITDDMTKPTSLENIGTMHYEKTDSFPVGNLLKLRENEPVDIAHIKPTITEIPVENEWMDTDEEWNKLKAQIKSGTMIYGAMPGSGKTHMATRLFKKEIKQRSVLVVCPANVLCRKTYKDMKKKCTVKNYNQLLGISMFNEPTNIQMDLKKYSVIIFDEFEQISVSFRERVKLMMSDARYKDKMFIGTGDGWQIPPIEPDVECWTIAKMLTYYKEITDSMFPYRISLKLNKRGENDEERQKFTEMSARIVELCKQWEDDDVSDKALNKKAAEIIKEYAQPITEISDNARHLCLYRQTRLFINTLLHKPTDKIFRIQNRCRGWTNPPKNIKQKKNTTAQVGYEVEIKKVKKNKINLYKLIVDDELTIYVPADKVEAADSILAPIYAQTIHSSQGTTYDDVIVMHNIDSYKSRIMTPMLLNVISTRGRSTKKLFYYTGKYNYPKDHYRERLRRNILNHIEFDTQGVEMDKLSGDICNLSVDDVLEIHRKQNGCCHLCGEELEESHISIDRIDNDYTHNKDNVRVAHHSCNTAKH